MEKLKNDDKWRKYVGLVKKNASLAGSDVKSLEAVFAVAKNVSDQLEASKTTLKLAGRTIVVRDVLSNVLDVLSVTKGVGASLTFLRPYASIT